nr:hypothetical protein CFP56_20149 [Quercus suber]
MLGGLKNSNETKSELNKETSRAGTTDLFRKQLEEIDQDLKPFDTHVTEWVAVEKQGVLGSNNTKLTQQGIKPEVKDAHRDGIDHKPVVIHPNGIPVRPNKPWWFEQTWLEDEGCHETIASAWRDGKGSSPMSRVVNKVGLSGGRVMSAILGLGSDACVAELIDQTTGSWDVQLLQNSFLPFEAQRLAAIPFNALAQPNFLYWSLEKKIASIQSSQGTRVYVKIQDVMKLRVLAKMGV